MLNRVAWNRIVYLYKNELNNLQRLIYHKTQINKQARILRAVLNKSWMQLYNYLVPIFQTISIR